MSEVNNTVQWGQGAVNNDKGWGQAAANNSINWGMIHEESWGHPETNLVGSASFATTFWQSITTQWQLITQTWN
jgi:hypothetical protein